MDKVKLMYDMARLAFETDSTRSISLMLDSVNSPAIEFGDHKTTDGYHNLSHHGRSAEKLAQLKAIDEWHMKLLNNLFTDLKNVREDGETLFDRTMVLYGSNLGNANTHVTTNLPTLFAGGGFRHGQHLAFDKDRNYPLPNLFVSMLQRMGIESDNFASSTGTMRGLELAEPCHHRRIELRPTGRSCVSFARYLRQIQTLPHYEKRLLIASTCLALAFAPFAQAEAAKAAPKGEEKHTELGERMEKLNGAFRKLKRQAGDATKNADSLTLVATIKTSAESAWRSSPRSRLRSRPPIRRSSSRATKSR